VEAVIRLLDGQSSTAKLMFMDGPYWMTLTPQADQAWLVECFAGHEKPAVEHARKIDSLSFTSSLLSAAGDLVEVCSRNNWSSSDIDSLSRLLPQLRTKMERGRPDVRASPGP
jgi:hypothetical protein